MIPSTKGEPIAITPNAVQYSIHLSPVIRVDRTLDVRSVIQLQRGERTESGEWTLDPAADAKASKMIPSLATFCAQHPAAAQAIGQAWAALDAAVAAINSELRLV